MVLAYPLPPLSQSLDSYPDPFLVNGRGIKLALVIGDNAGLDSIGATDTALGLGKVVHSSYKDTLPSISLASEIEDLTAWNAILVGGPCVNKHTATAMGLNYPACGVNSGIEKNTAIIEIKENGDNYLLIVAGHELEDTKRAGRVLKNYKDFLEDFKGKTKVVVTGKSLDLEDIKVE